MIFSQKVMSTDGQALSSADLNSEILVGAAGVENRVLGIHQRPLDSHRRLYKINGSWIISSDQLVWTNQGWGCIDQNLYRMRSQSLESLHGGDMFLFNMIDADKLVPFDIGTVLLFADQSEQPVQSIVLLSHAEGMCLIPIMAGNHSYSLEGGLVVDGCLGYQMSKELVLKELNFAPTDMVKTEA